VLAEINPEPAPEEREARLAALARLDRGPDGPPAWWEAGIREAVEDEAAESPAG
jgi:hypothetical protein